MSKAPNRQGSHDPHLVDAFLITQKKEVHGGSYSALRHFSIFVGGPVYDFLFRIGMLRFGLPNIVRRIAVLVAVTWLPLLVLSLADGLAFGHRVKIPSYMISRRTGGSCSACHYW